MSKPLTLLIALVIVVGALFIIRSYNHREEGISSKEVVSPTAQASKSKDWREFSSVSGHFKVMLPALPQHVSDNIVDPKTKELRRYETFVAADDDGEAFMISVITFSHNVEQEVGGDSLKAVIDDMLSRKTTNKLQLMNPGTLNTFKTLDFSIINGDRIIAGKAFAKGNTVYLLSMIDNNDRFKTHDFGFFVNSFEIVDSKPKKD